MAEEKPESLISIQREMLSQLRFQGLRHRLGLAEWPELRQVADEALNAEIYTPSLVDAAFDANEWLYEIGAAFEKALKALEIYIPESKEECCWSLLHYHISQIESGVVQPQTGLKGVMEAFYGCKLFDQSTNYVGDSHDIEAFICAYWGYDDLLERPQEVTYNDIAGEAAFLELDAYVLVSCKDWIEHHPDYGFK
jgi:hypothetical protein